MSEYKVVHISDIDTEQLFQTNQYLLGDKTGNWFIVSEDIILRRFEDKNEALEEAKELNETPIDPKLANMTVEELLKHADDLIKEASEFVKNYL
jgi:hypothetical protein